ncbi:HipA family kinase [Pseudalkalibacillus sp. Hm43]|uniref:HipA family kinase n=1 Tax=Pseudalkalibacillus sp. Hm43 TaxID=3450742 RepID=UPI003F42AC26
MVTPIKVIKELHGFTRPQIIQFDNERQYVVKFQHYLGGSKYLVREYVIGRLAQELNLPIVQFDTIQIPKSFIRKNGRLFKHRFKHGTQFCSEYLTNCIDLNKFRPNEHQLINRDAGPKVFVFDVWTGNKDRHRKNILCQKLEDDQYFIHIIDHTHTFAETNYQQLHSSKKHIHDWLLSISNCKDATLTFIKQIEEFPEDKLDELLESIPSDWKVTDQKKQAIKAFLERSKEQLAKNMNAILAT